MWKQGTNDTKHWIEFHLVTKSGYFFRFRIAKFDAVEPVIDSITASILWSFAQTSWEWHNLELHISFVRTAQIDVELHILCRVELFVNVQKVFA